MYTCNYLGGYTCNCRLGYELHSDERRCENACGGLIDASNGTITSPSFPDIYPSNKEYIHTQLNFSTSHMDPGCYKKLHKFSGLYLYTNIPSYN